MKATVSYRPSRTNKPRKTGGISQSRLKTASSGKRNAKLNPALQDKETRRNLALIAERLKQLRQRHNLTEEEVAALIGVSLRIYRLIEAGLSDIRLETLERIADGFGIKPWQFLAPELPTDTRLAFQHR